MNTAPPRIIVGFSPGRAADDIAHLISAPLAARRGRQVLIGRIAGESGTHALAPRGTSAAMVDNISKAAAAVINSDVIAATLIAAGISPMGLSPLAFERFIAAELQRWKPVVARFASA